MKNLALLISLACLSTALFGCGVQLSEEDKKGMQKDIQALCSSTKPTARLLAKTYEACVESTEPGQLMADKKLNLSCKLILEVAKERGCI